MNVQFTSYPNNQLVSLHISENLFCVAPFSLVVCPTNFNYLPLCNFNILFSTVQDPSTLLRYLLSSSKFRKWPTERVGWNYNIFLNMFLFSQMSQFWVSSCQMCENRFVFVFCSSDVLRNFLTFSSSRASLIPVALMSRGEGRTFMC